MDHGARIVSLGCGPLPFLHVESHAYRPGRIKDDGFRSDESARLFVGLSPALSDATSHRFFCTLVAYLAYERVDHWVDHAKYYHGLAKKFE